MDGIFSRIRHGLKEHIEQGRLRGSGSELDCYISLHLHAELDTGVCWKMSAPFLARFLGADLFQVQLSLRSLERKGYIKRFNHRGQKSFYPILINKYETPHGLIIRADKTLSLDEIAFETNFNCILITTQMKLNCISNQFQVTRIQELREIKNIEKGEGAAPAGPARPIPASSGPPALKPESLEDYKARVNRYFDSLSKEWYEKAKAVWPALEVAGAVLRAREWLLVNNTQRKSNLGRFVTNWLNKDQEKARGGGHAQANISNWASKDSTGNAEAVQRGEGVGSDL